VAGSFRPGTLRCVRVRWLSVLVLPVLALTACGSDDDPPAATLPPISSSTPTPTATPSAIPTEATAATPEGAAEFVRFFYERVERAYATKNPSLIEALTTPACDTCRRVTDAVAQLQTENASVSNYRLDVVDVAVPAVSGDMPQVNATVVLNITEFVRLDAAGNETARQPARSNAVQDLVLVRPDGEQWRVQSVTSQ
jgi:thiol-disulfide isomerase/thioredoxin